MSRGTPEEKLRAEWFWCDRWDGSSASLLPLEARGLYREMLTQSWRRGARLPKDPAQIQRAIRCTPEEWARCWPLVRPYWREENGNLVNDTQLEVYADCKSRMDGARARAQGAAQARWDGKRKHIPEHMPQDMPEHVPEHMLEECPPSKSMSKAPSLSSSSSSSPSKTNDNDHDKRIAPAARSDSALAKTPPPQAVEAQVVTEKPWSQDACDLWIARFNGTAPGGVIGKSLLPLVKKFGWPRVRKAWRQYLGSKDFEFAKAPDFAATFGVWDGSRPESTAGGSGLAAEVMGSMRGDDGRRRLE